MVSSILPSTPLCEQGPPSSQLCAAIYARVSTEDQGKGYSIPTQIEACQRLAQQHAYTVLESHIFIDDGITGTTLDRPALRALRDGMRTGGLAAVIVLDPDRLARKTGKLLVLKEEMDLADVKLLCVSHPIEEGAEGSLFFQMRGVLAEYEREKLLERTRRGLLGRIKAGHPHGGGVPLGYRYVSEPHRGHYVIDEEEAELVRRIFHMYLQGMNLRAIATQFINEGVPTHADRRRTSGKGSKWSTSALSLILRNETYIGCLQWNKRKHTGTTSTWRPKEEWMSVPVPAIVSEDIFRAVQARIAKNKADNKRSRKHEYLFLAGRLRCGRCGGPMTGYSSHDKRRYRCLSQVWHPTTPEGFCRGGLLADDIEGPVWDTMERILMHPELITDALEQHKNEVQEVAHDADQETRVLLSARGKLEREMHQWERAYAGEVISLEEYATYKREIQDKLAVLQAQEQELQESLRKLTEKQDLLESLEQRCHELRERLYPADFPKKRLILEAFEIQVTWARGERPRMRGNIDVRPDLIPNATCCDGHKISFVLTA